VAQCGDGDLRVQIPGPHGGLVDGLIKHVQSSRDHTMCAPCAYRRWLEVVSAVDGFGRPGVIRLLHQHEEFEGHVCLSAAPVVQDRARSRVLQFTPRYGGAQPLRAIPTSSSNASGESRCGPALLRSDWTTTRSVTDLCAARLSVASGLGSERNNSWTPGPIITLLGVKVTEGGLWWRAVVVLRPLRGWPGDNAERAVWAVGWLGKRALWATHRSGA
jgi:hypothetical protein